MLKYFLLPLMIPFLPVITQAQVTIEPENRFDKLIWSDEFEGEGVIDTTKWFQQTQLPPWGEWFGGLINHYTDRVENAYLKNGNMHLVAKKEKFNDQGYTKEYTSVRLNSKFAFTYGRVEVRAKLPEGTGTWPAIWMLSKDIDEAGAYWEKQGFGTTGWPECGEIDILEHWGKRQDYVSSALHNAADYGYNVTNVGEQKIDGASSEFHVYIMEWTEDEISFAVDGVEHLRYKPEEKNEDNWPYDKNYYLLFNIAIEKDIDPEFRESAMVVDYIRVYQ